MCLTIKNSEHFRFFGRCFPKIAKEDIVAYKVLKDYGDGYIITPYQYAQVCFVHGTDTLSATFKVRRYRNKIYEVSEGIHSLQKPITSLPVHCKIYYAIIPKGSKYYIGTRLDFVSTELIIFKTEEDYLDYIKNNTHGKPCKEERQC